jgi:hypothetical protein
MEGFPLSAAAKNSLKEMLATNLICLPTLT